MNETGYKVFDPKEELKDAKNFSGVLVSPRRSGKTFLLRYILYQIKNWYKMCYVFSGTADVQQGSDNPYDFCPKENITDGLDVEKINKIYEQQKERVIKSKNAGKEPPLILLVFDDIINEDVNIKNVNAIKKIFTKGRWLNIAIIILNQYFTALPPVVRGNCDFVGCQRLTTKDDKINFVRAYLSIESDIQGVEILKEITNEDYQFLMVNLMKRSYNIKDFVMKLKAEKVPKFVIKNRLNAPEIINDEEEALAEQEAPKKPTNIHTVKKRF